MCRRCKRWHTSVRMTMPFTIGRTITTLALEIPITTITPHIKNCGVYWYFFAAGSSAFRLSPKEHLMTTYGSLALLGSELLNYGSYYKSCMTSGTRNPMICSSLVYQSHARFAVSTVGVSRTDVRLVLKCKQSKLHAGKISHCSCQLAWGV